MSEKTSTDVALQRKKKVLSVVGDFFFYFEEFDLFLSHFFLMWLLWEYSHWMERGKKEELFV